MADNWSLTYTEGKKMPTSKQFVIGFFVVFLLYQVGSFVISAGKATVQSYENAQKVMQKKLQLLDHLER